MLSPENCPICRAPPQGAFVTPCSHIYCYECITTHLAKQSNCPLCAQYLIPTYLVPYPRRVGTTPPTTSPPPSPPPSQPPSLPPARTPDLSTRTPDLTATVSSRRNAPPPLRPSVALPRPLATPPAVRRARAEARADATLRADDVSRISDASSCPQPPPASTFISSAPVSDDVLLAVGDKLSAEQLAGVIARLNQKLQEKEGCEKRVETDLLLHFLRHTRSEKQAKIDRLRSEVELLELDVQTAESHMAALPPETSSTTTLAQLSSSKSHVPNPPNVRPVAPQLAKKRRRISHNYDVLQTCYFSTVAVHTGEARRLALRRFTDDIFKLTKYSRFQDRATLMHVARVPDGSCNDVFKASNIVSSIEFDRESEFLATAGVTRRIKIFEFTNIVRNLTDIHYPVKEIVTPAKLSWVCWNPYIRFHLVSSDYDGFVTLWDVNRGTALREYEEHENRAWSVDYCPTQPTLFASGSDDGRVKLWTTSQRESIRTIDNKPANVCSVKFHPTAPEKLAFGSVDFNVHYYDLRNTKQALQVFKSHSRAVSYVKFMSPTELVSASVDSTIKLWNLSDMSLARTFTGHMNDKNFVGLSVTEDYIATGSEENTVYSYYKSIPRPFTGYRFSGVNPLTGEETRDDDESQFVSSVCWCPKDPKMLVAANSLGAMKVLALDTGDSEEESEEKEEMKQVKRESS